MDLLESYYDKLSFTLYSLFAVVPGRNVWPRRIFLSIFGVFVTLFTIFQAMKFVVYGITLPIAIDILPAFSTTISCVSYLFYVVFSTEEEFRTLLWIMWDDLKQKRSQEENEIKQKYATSAKTFKKFYTAILFGTAAGMCVVGFVPYLLDLIIPGNQTREKELVVKGEFFIDQQKYFYQLYFIESCVVGGLGILVVASENMCIIILQHLCGMFAVVGHRLKNITRAEEFDMLNNDDYVRLVTSRLHICIEGHQKTLHFAVLSAAFYDIPLTIALLGTFCTLTVSLVQVMDPEVSVKWVKIQLVSLKIIIYTTGHFFQFLLLSCMGQIEINASEGISEYAYNAEWHICSPDVRRMLQLVILRSSRPCEIIARRMYTLSIENFMSVIQGVTSFYMVLRKSQ